LKEPLRLVFVCIGNRNRSPFAEFFFLKLISERDKSLIGKIEVISAGFIPHRMRDRMAKHHIELPEPFFGRSIAQTTRAVLLGQGITVSDKWRTRALTTEIVDRADLIITALPDQKKDLAELYPKFGNKIFTIREMSKWDGYLLQEDYGFNRIPSDNKLWEYVEEDYEYVTNILLEMEKMLIGAYPHILECLGLQLGGNIT
jgi:protein-tyrosine-phosphatase